LGYSLGQAALKKTPTDPRTAELSKAADGLEADLKEKKGTARKAKSDMVNRGSGLAKLEAELHAADRRRKALKKSVKKWVDDFKAREGRAPEQADKEANRDEFLAYKDAVKEVEDLQAKVNEATASVKSAGDRLKEAEEAVQSSASAFEAAVQVRDEHVSTVTQEAEEVERIASLHKQVADLTTKLTAVTAECAVLRATAAAETATDADALVTAAVGPADGALAAQGGDKEGDSKPLSSKWPTINRLLGLQVSDLRAELTEARSEVEKEKRALAEAKAAEATRSKDDEESKAAAGGGADGGVTVEALQEEVARMMAESTRHADEMKLLTEKLHVAQAKGGEEMEALSMKLERLTRAIASNEEDIEELTSRAEVAETAKAMMEEELEENTALVASAEALQEQKETLEATVAELRQRIALNEQLQKAKLKQEADEKAKRLANLTGVGAEGQKEEDDPLPSEEELEHFKEYAKQLQDTLVTGSGMWKAKKRDECVQLYRDECDKVARRLPNHGKMRTSLTTALSTSRGQNPAKATGTLRRAFEQFAKDVAAVDVKVQEAAVAAAAAAEGKDGSTGAGLLDLEKMNVTEVEAALRALDEKAESLEAALGVNDHDDGAIGGASNGGGVRRKLRDRAEAAETRVAELEKDLFKTRAKAEAAEAEAEAAKQRAKKMEKRGSGGGGGGSEGEKSGGQISKADAAKLKTMAKEKKELESKVQKLEKKLETAETANANAMANADDGKDSKKALKKIEKKHQKEVDNLNKQIEKAARKQEASEKEQAETSTQLAERSKEVAALRKQLEGLETSGSEAAVELERLKHVEEELVEVREEAAAAEEKLTRVEGLYQDEQRLRKKYHNEIEDMKGKIRVYARCRPMAAYEIERNCEQVLTFTSDQDLEVMKERGPKPFTFDAVFPPTTAQETVFEDCRHLVQSCLDGYNVCIFAYGQTGSGKTFTMTGSPELPGLTPRAIHELYDLIEAANNSGTTVTVKSYFMELYNDQLVDLYHGLDHKGDKKDKPPKLDIKLDTKKMVYIKNAEVKQADSAEDLLALFEAGNTMRHVGSTAMNAESSRSHSIFSVLVEVYNETTRKTTTGKLSLIDLAGSERADKTGAKAERLREAQSINKSLSALCDVISALSTNASFVPYRNNKLTQMMQDSLGGNAKTLMFVNISPADYNRDETLGSLEYAARAKLITNDAAKNADSEEVAALKAEVAKLERQLLGGAVAAEVGVGVGSSSSEAAEEKRQS